MGSTRVALPAKVLEGIQAVRLSGLTNMLDVPVAVKLASEMGYGAAATWIHKNRRLYGDGIFRGFEADETLSADGQTEGGDERCAGRSA